MRKMKEEDFLNLPEVVEEIKRHLWLESEKVGHDIGFDQAKDEWLSKYSKGWIKENIKPKAKASTSGAKSTTVKKRRAKSYVAKK